MFFFAKRKGSATVKRFPHRQLCKDGLSLRLLSISPTGNYFILLYRLQSGTSYESKALGLLQAFDESAEWALLSSLCDDSH